MAATEHTVPAGSPDQGPPSPLDDARGVHRAGAEQHHSTTLAAFTARVRNTKNRLIAIPADVQRQLGLARRKNNHIVSYTIRPVGRGR